MHFRSLHSWQRVWKNNSKMCGINFSSSSSSKKINLLINVATRVAKLRAFKGHYSN